MRSFSLSDILGGNIENAQAMMYDTMKKMTDKSHRLRIHEFITFKTLDARLPEILS